MEARFIEALKEALELDSIEVKTEDKFREYEGWSSLKELSILAMMDSDFGVNLEMKDFNKLITVGDLIGYVKNQNK
jgi:acyl carrier protein